MELTQKSVQDYFTLDPLTGILYHRHAKQGTRQGAVAGSLNKVRGRWRVKVNTKTFWRSRVIFLYVHGYLPPHVDHRNRNKLDDRPDNLRAADIYENRYNRTGQGGRILPKGVYFSNCKRKFRAGIMIRGKRIGLGTHATAEEAQHAYQEAARKYHGEFVCEA